MFYAGNNVWRRVGFESNQLTHGLSCGPTGAVNGGQMVPSNRQISWPEEASVDATPRPDRDRRWRKRRLSLESSLATAI